MEQHATEPGQRGGADQYATLRPRIEALLACAHAFTTPQAPSQLRGELDLNSLSRERLEAYLRERGVSPPPGYGMGDLVILAKQAKSFMKKPTAPSSPCGFTLARRASLIREAGEGVFIQGKAKKGTVVAFYPGCVYAEPDLPLVYPHIYIDNSYLAFRPDKMLIDASSKGSSRQAFLAAWARDRPRQQVPTDETIDFARLFSNPFAVGHFINHPPPDTRPNVISVPFDFLEGEFPDHLRPYVPNVYFLPGTQPPAASSSARTLVSGMVVVAAKDLEDGEELLMDYHYNTQGTSFPSWYRPTAGISQQQGE